MPRMNRRRALIYIGTLAFGASGVVASGAFTTGSQGSLGDNWIQVAGTDQAVSFESPQQVDGGAGSDGDGEGDDDSDEETTDNSEGESDDGSDEGQPDDEAADDSEETDEQDEDSQDDGGGGDDDDGESETGTTRVQVVTAPDNPGNAVNGGGSATWDGTIVASSAVRGTGDGFFRGVTAEDVNRNATSTIGYLQDGYPNGSVAFIIANVGPEEEGAQTGSVGVTATLFADGAVLETDQLRFPYRVVDSDGAAVARGENLFTAGDVTLADGHVIEVVIVVDTNDGDEDLERLDTLQFTATGVGS